MYHSQLYEYSYQTWIFSNENKKKQIINTDGWLIVLILSVAFKEYFLILMNCKKKKNTNKHKQNDREINTMIWDLI